MARLRAVRISHARGLSGQPSVGHRSAGAGEGVLRGLLGDVEVAEETDEDGDDAAPVLPEDVVVGGGHQ